MQYRSPLGPGPSGNTWPRWPPQRLQRTSTRSMPWPRSSTSSTASVTIGSEKLGQPVPDSNLVDASNSGVPQPAQWYVPSSWQSQYFPVKARSVPAWRSTWNCSGESSSRHSESAFSTS